MGEYVKEIIEIIVNTICQTVNVVILNIPLIKVYVALYPINRYKKIVFVMAGKTISLARYPMTIYILKRIMPILCPKLLGFCFNSISIL